VNEIYDQKFTASLVKRDGVTAELLRKNGIQVVSSDEYL
jgi:uncharacterized protein YbbK (DUF523 family)